MPWARTFGLVGPGEPLLYEDSYGRACIAVEPGTRRAGARARGRDPAATPPPLIGWLLPATLPPGLHEEMDKLMRTLKGVTALAFVAAIAAACSSGGATPSPAASAAPSVAPSAASCRPHRGPVADRRRLRAGEPHAQDRRQADHRRRQPGLPAVLRAVGRRRTEPWELGDPTERQGLRERLRVSRSRSKLGFAKDAVTWVADAVQQLVPARAEGRSTSTSTRCPTSPSARRPSTCPTATTTWPSPIVALKANKHRRRDVDRRPQGRQVRRPGRHDQPADDHRRHRADHRGQGLRHERRRDRGPQERARSTASSSTCRRRST